MNEKTQDLNQELGYIETLLKRVENKNGHITCCLPCHFHFEEEEAFKYIPEADKKWIKEEHKAMGSHPSPEVVLDHSKRERVVFEAYCPKDVLSRIDADHLHYCKQKGVDFCIEGCTVVFQDKTEL